MSVTAISLFFTRSTPHRVPIGPGRPTVLQVIVAQGRTQIDPISTPTANPISRTEKKEAEVGGERWERDELAARVEVKCKENRWRRKRKEKDDRGERKERYLRKTQPERNEKGGKRYERARRRRTRAREEVTRNVWRKEGAREFARRRKEVKEKGRCVEGGGGEGERSESELCEKERKRIGRRRAPPDCDRPSTFSTTPSS